MKEIPSKAVAAVKKWLGKDGIRFFRACKKYHGRLDPVFSVWNKEDAKLTDEAIKRMADPKNGPPLSFSNAFGLSKKAKRPLPHPVHFREGMKVRNVLRGSDACKDWSNDDFENLWTKVVEQAII